LLLAGARVGCGGLPKSVGRVASTAFLSPLETTLGQQLAEQNRRHADESVDQGRDAFYRRERPLIFLKGYIAIKLVKRLMFIGIPA
jgi:hypothetical protein